MQRDVLIKNWNFHKNKQIKKEKVEKEDELSNNPIIWDDNWKIIPRRWEVN